MYTCIYLYIIKKCIYIYIYKPPTPIAKLQTAGVQAQGAGAGEQARGHHPDRPRPLSEAHGMFIYLSIFIYLSVYLHI
jgi:hypothetical protein